MHRTTCTVLFNYLLNSLPAISWLMSNLTTPRPIADARRSHVDILHWPVTPCSSPWYDKSTMIGSGTTADKRLVPGSTVTGCLTMVSGTVITLVVPLVQRRCRGRLESPTESSRRSVSLCGIQEPTAWLTMIVRGSCQPFVVVTNFRKTVFR